MKRKENFKGEICIYPKVAIIILNWKGWEDTIECLESLHNIKYPDFNIILVDNGSENNSVDEIKKYADGINQVNSYNEFYRSVVWSYIEYSQEEANGTGGKEFLIQDFPSQKKFVLIKNKKNIGFAEGNNVGMEYALKFLKPEYILLLNNDTVVDGNFLTHLVEYGQRNENIGALGPKIFYFLFDGRKDIIWSAGGSINMWTGSRKTNHYRESDNNSISVNERVDFVSGAALLIKSKIIHEIGLLDPEYFTYTEDIDWCFRIKKAGYKIVFDSDSKIWHKVSKSTGSEFSSSSFFFIVRSSIIFMKKNAKFYQWPTYVFFSGINFFLRFLKVDSIRKKSMLKGVLSHIKKDKW